MKSNKEKGDELERYIVSLLEEVFPKVKQSIGSGNSKFKGDIHGTKGWRWECKKRNTDNCIIQRKWWLKLLKELNVYNQETPVLILQNKHKETFACLEIKDFIKLLKERHV